MPELPEVETIRRNLRRGGENTPSLVDKEITGALVLWERSLAAPELTDFFARVQGQRIDEIGRRGKYFVFQLTWDYLLVHLRMSGDLMMEKQDEPIDPYHRVVLFLEGDWRLSFTDTRKFGRIWLVGDSQEVLGSLGPEPLDPDFTADIFYNRLCKCRRQIKPLLLDQSFLAGVGNIYADEALHLAGLHPLTIASHLDEEHAQCLWSSLRKVLQEGIEHNGASIDWIFRGGEQQHFFRVYGRQGEPCLKCGTAIERIEVGQRGTHLCPVCQGEGA